MIMKNGAPTQILTRMTEKRAQLASPFCASVGVLLVILPWRPEWTDNYFLLASPGLRTFVSNGFVRGLCSGLGLLDIWIGFWEAVHFHDGTRP